jgi:Protein of unknown function (DUF3375)
MPGAGILMGEKALPFMELLWQDIRLTLRPLRRSFLIPFHHSGCYHFVPGGRLRHTKAGNTIATFRRLREQSLWRLLASANGPAVMGLLQTHLFEGDRRLPASIFYERLNRDLQDLLAQGEDLPRTAQAYVADWLAAGYLERRFPAGASEEEYELSAAAAAAIRFAAGLVEPHTMATESRLAVVIQQLVRLAQETDANPETRIATLLSERERIDEQIEAIRQGRLQPLPDARALERVHDIIALAEGLAGDFRRVRDRFEQLNRDLRERLMDNDASRGEVLEALFAGVDVIAESDAGRTFSAFWRLLTNPEQSSTLEQAIDEVVSRDFAVQMDSRDRRFLLRLTRMLLEQGGMVHEVLQHFARSLRHFVQSREYLEQRRFNQLLQEAQRAALSLKDEVRATGTLEYTLPLTSSRLRSLAQWVLFDPAAQAPRGGMLDGESAPIDLDIVGELIAQSEIDFRVLKANIRALLRERSQTSIGEVMHRFPVTQGLGSVVGYIALGARHGVRGDRIETVEWEGQDERCRRARIPAIYFVRERVHELTCRRPGIAGKALRKRQWRTAAGDAQSTGATARRSFPGWTAAP